MKVKCQSVTLNVNDYDRVVDNGKNYVVATRELFIGDLSYHPTIAKETFEQLFKDGDLIKLKEKYQVDGAEYDLYRFKGVEE